MITEEEYNKGGYGKFNLKKDYIEHVHSRAVDDKGRVRTGEAGRRLQREKKAKQEWLKRK